MRYRLYAAACVVILAIIGWVRAGRVPKGALFTTGTVVGHEKRDHSEGWTWHPKIEVKTLDGEVLRFTSKLGSNPNSWPVGSKVDVRADLADLEHFDPRLFRTGILMAAGLAFFMILAATNDPG